MTGVQTCALPISGTGKSTLAAYLVEQARRRTSPDEVVVCFFGDNKRQDSAKQSSTLILKVIIAQLIKTERVDEKALRELMDHVLSKGADYRYSVRDLRKHLSSLLESFTRTW